MPFAGVFPFTWGSGAGGAAVGAGPQWVHPGYSRVHRVRPHVTRPETAKFGRTRDDADPHEDDFDNE